MGYAIAEAAVKKGADVTLISGPTAPSPSPPQLKTISVVSAEEMYRAVMKHAPKADIVIMAAAVSDWRPARYSNRKVKKTNKPLRVSLVRTPDILEELGRRKRGGQILVGFAAETERLVQNARKKLRRKNLDLIVANRVGKGTGFGSDKTRLVLMTRSGLVKKLPLLPKKTAAKRLLTILLHYHSDLS